MDYAVVKVQSASAHRSGMTLVLTAGLEPATYRFSDGRSSN